MRENMSDMYYTGIVNQSQIHLSMSVVSAPFPANAQ